MDARVLVVDDDRAIRLMLELSLSFEGFEVATAAHGGEALERALETRPDVVLLDVMMPELNGFEVAKQLRATPTTADIPIVMLTACATERDMWAGWQSGAASYLTKPIEHGILLEEIKRVLRAPAA